MAVQVKGKLRVHAAAGGEEFLALDGKTYTLRAGQIAISDDVGVESLAGIMGGEVSGCTPETTDVFLESAWWDPITTATTGRTGVPKAASSARNSASISRPAAAGSNRASPSVELCARCAAEKASFT